MKYAVEMVSSVMIYIPSFVKIGSAIQKLVGEECTDTQTARASHSLLLFFKKKESNPKRKEEEKTISHHFVP
jgi:hypothetical protein